jgi:hypothetical protein
VEQALIALAAALVAVSATEWSVRIRDRRRKIEEATLQVVFLVPALIVPISERWTDPPPDTGTGSDWDQRRERVDALLIEARVRSYWPLRRWREIRREVEDLAARVTAAHFDWAASKKRVRAEDTLEITGAKLMGAVFGQRPYIDEAIKFYRSYGYGRRPVMAESRRIAALSRFRLRRHPDRGDR